MEMGGWLHPKLCTQMRGLLWLLEEAGMLLPVPWEVGVGVLGRPGGVPPEAIQGPHLCGSCTSRCGGRRSGSCTS